MTFAWQTITSEQLKSIPNPASGYEHKISIPEFTFLGVREQPDFGIITIWFYGDAKTIELKSLKEYLYQYRNTIISYERCIDVMYNHLMDVYEPTRLKLQIEFRPRGGITSIMTRDSDFLWFGTELTTD